MISEWMHNGTLKAFLENPTTKGSNRLHFVRLIRFRRKHSKALLTQAYQLSEGIKYLHNHRPPVAHGDLKAVIN